MPEKVPNPPKEEKTPQNEADEATKAYQKKVETVNEALKPTGLTVAGQLSLILADGTQVPIRGIVANPVVVDENQQTQSTSGKDEDDKPSPEKAE